LNGQAGRAALCRQIFAALAPAAIVETGTFRGTSTEFFAEVGVPVYSVEADPRIHAFAQQRFRSGAEPVHLALGDSRTFLRQLAADPAFPKDGVFFYLDAHWGPELPLAEEITIIFDNWRRAVVMIDDFEVPGDAYSYDDYGPGAALTADYLDAVGRTDMVRFYPSLPAAEETGAQRGCIVLCNDPDTRQVLGALSSLRPAHAAPAFSIIVPTFNAATVLRACLDSIAGQTFRDYEVILVDGRSTDGTLDIAQSFTAVLDSRLIIHSDTDRGVYDAMNHGVEMSSGTWVYFLGSDDVLFEPDTLARVAAFISDHEASDLIYGDVALVSDGSRNGSRDIGVYDLDRLLFDCNIYHQSIFYRRELFATIGPYNLRYPAYADWDFNIRCFSNPALVTQYMDLIVARYNDLTGVSNEPDREMIKRLPVFVGLRWAATERNPVDPWWVFFLARCYSGVGDWVNARTWFARRAEMASDDEETFIALWQLAEMMALLGEPWANVHDAFLKAWEFRPTRAEPLCFLAFQCSRTQRYHLGYLIAQAAAEIPFPEHDRLMVRTDVYAWRAVDEQAVCASWIGKQDEAFTLWRGLIARIDVSDGEREKIAANRDICVPTMLAAASAYPETVVRSLTAGSGDPDVVISLDAGPDLAATEKTLNSFLNCCTDVTRVGGFLLIDAGLPPEDRAILRERYGFAQFGEPCPAARYRLHLESGWRFFAPDNLITRLTAVLAAEPEVFQVGINLADATALTGTSAAEDVVRRAPDTGRYVLTDTPYNGPAMIDTTRIDRADTLHTASLDEVLCLKEAR
jgi:glycosyltransferase involved in cell wall biosynthesis